MKTNKQIPTSGILMLHRRNRRSSLLNENNLGIPFETNMFLLAGTNNMMTYVKRLFLSGSLSDCVRIFDTAAFPARCRKKNSHKMTEPSRAKSTTKTRKISIDCHYKRQYQTSNPPSPTTILRAVVIGEIFSQSFQIFSICELCINIHEEAFRHHLCVCLF